MNKVSVIVPVYNSVGYVERCVRGLLEQTLSDVQLIFIDDGSTDGSPDYIVSLVDEYPDRKNSVTVRRCETNRGQAICRAEALELADGEYIYYCDSDDWVESSFLSNVYGVAKKNDSDIVCCDIRYWKGDKVERVWKQQVKSAEDLCSGLINASYSGILSNKLFRRSLLSSDITPPRYNMGEDWALCVQYASYARRVSYAEGECYNFNMRVGSSSFSDTFESSRKKYEFFLNNFELVTEFLKSKSLERRYHYDLVRRSLSLRFSILPYIGEKDALKLWNNTSPELKWDILFAPNISVREKVLFVCVSTGLCTFYKRLKPNREK